MKIVHIFFPIIQTEETREKDKRISGRKESCEHIQCRFQNICNAMNVNKEVVEMISKSIELKTKSDFKTRKLRKKRFSEMSPKEQSDLIKKDQRWGRIVCRCEHVTEAEVIEALSNPIGAQTLSAVKYRCRAGMGRCQGGFCTQHIVRIMEEQFKINVNKMNLKSSESKMFIGRTREKND